MMRRNGTRLGLIVATCVVGVHLPSVSILAAQTFRSTVELIAIDVHVHDAQGRPLAGLRPEDFEVTLDGRRRRVVSAVFTRYETPTSAPALPRGGQTAATELTAASDLPGRTFVIAVDTSSFRPVEARLAAAAAERFTRLLTPADQIGVVILPNGPMVPPSDGRARVRQILASVVGLKPTADVSEMAIEEIIDITAAMSGQSQIESRRTVGRILTADPDLGDASDSVQCSGPLALCTERAMTEAASLATALEHDLVRGLGALETLLAQLQALAGRKTVVLLSGGMPVSDRLGGRPALMDEVRRLGQQATSANATIHSVFFDPSLDESFSAGARRRGGLSGRALNIHTRALAEFAGPSGGLFLTTTTGRADAEMERLARDASASYLLGVEPDDRDRDGRVHRLRVRVDRRDVTVRSRQSVVVPKL
jgi:VWFA-related protein